MRVTRTSIAAILAFGLLAGSAVGVAAQDEETGDSDAEVQFVSIWAFDPESSQFTGFGSIPGGTTEWFSSSLMGEYAESDVVGHAHTFDPGEPGGGTFQVQVSGDVTATLDSGTVLAEGTWSVTPGSGTEEYEGLWGEGSAFVVVEPDSSAVIVYRGTVTPAE